MKLKLLDKLIMLSKLSLYGLVVQCFMLSSIWAEDTSAQKIQSVSDVTVEMEFTNAKLEKVFKMLENHTDFRFSYSKEDIDRSLDISFRKGESLRVRDILIDISKKSGLKFRQVNRNIIVQKGNIRNKQNNDVEVIIEDVDISGKITDENGEGLPGASIVIKGTSTGTTSDLDGNYSMSAAIDAVLVVSFVGYSTQEITVGSQTVIDIAMLLDAAQLEEVVVVGYGTQKKVNLTGSVEQVEGSSLTKQPVFQVSSALTGAVPGLTVVQGSGQPGKDVGSIVIRGLGSLGSGSKNEPLVLIDGVQGDINGIDPSDIENMSVLKDAAASSIYGSRAANGVILITTKRAKEGEIKVGYKSYIGKQSVTGRPKFLGGLEFLKHDGSSSQAVIDDYAANIGKDPDRYADTDWVNELYSESGFMQYHQISASGGTDRLTVAASLSYQEQNGNIPNFNFKRYNGRFNSDFKVSDKFKINFDLNFSQGLTKEPSTGLNLINREAFRTPPIYFVRHSDGSWGDAWGGQNPIAFAEASGLNVVENNYFRSVTRLNYEPIKGLNLSLMYSPEYGDTYGKEFVRTIDTIIDWDLKTTRTTPNRSSLSQSNNRSLTHNLNAIASYTLDFNNQSLTALAGYEMIKTNSSGFGAYRDQFILQNYQVLNAGSQENDSNSGSASHNGLLSYFGRVNYSIGNKYLFEANIRRDASSRFAKANRASVFPSFSVGWRVAEESFFPANGLFSDLKLRASWGQLGNQQIGSDFPYVSSIALGSSNYVFGNTVFTGATQNVLANEAIQWETTETTNFGVDASAFKNKLNLTAEYYIRKTNDILLQIPIPLNVGLDPATQNAASLENRGWDLSLGWQDDINDFTYNVRFIASNVKNKVTDLAGVGPIISGTGITTLGKPINSIYGYETQGIFQSQDEIDNAPAQIGTLKPGNLRYKDQLTVDTNNDGIPDAADGLINGDDRVIIGNSFPQMSYSFNLGFQYKGFDLSFAFQGVTKRDVRLGGDVVWPLYNAGKIQEWQLKESWTPENPNAKFPILSPTSAGSNDIQTSSTYVFDGSYLRLRNINFGYSLPSSLLENILISYARVYFSGQNLITWDKMPDGVDPLVPSGSQGEFYPIVSSYTFGIEVRF
ncbi:SusC/RagA family TonB-linked outer membrane protein [Reichenbachiella sp. MALMAid0571]|uniref:SusC/RagA family TonB-linked outer membrane protein n=1 Tax=Reichenbachiella sp. MALMAid0571 TaxID=3143939 RepID=UPI0032DF4FA0